MAACMIDVLPNELLTSILVCLTASEIKLCRLVCRRIKEVIALSPSLQFIIELDNAGYVAATNSRTDLSLDEKLRALRLHNSRRVNHAVNSIDAFKIGISNGGFSMRRELLTSSWAPLFKDGMIAQWSSVSPDSYTPLQLDLVQLPSLNTGTALKQWRITQQDMNVRSYDMEPACDLLVLLEYTGADTSPFINPILTPDGQVHRSLFHFRTLSTNEVHPSAIVGTLDCDLHGNAGWGFPLSCRGDLIIARPDVAGPSQFMSDDGAGLIIYNWTTGALLDLRNATFPKFLAVLSNQVVIVPRSTFTYSSRNSPMGILDIYFIDWSDTPSLSLVAVLELPIVTSVPIPPPGLHGISEDHIAIFCRCFPGSGFFSSQEAPYAVGPPRVFEPSESSQLMRMQFSLPYLGLNQDARGRLSSLLYIPFRVLYETVASSRQQFSTTGLPRRIPWEEWGLNTRWIHSKLWDNALLQSRGSRSMLTRHYPSRAEGTSRLELYVVDFNPTFVKSVEYQQSQRAGNKNAVPEPGTWVFQPRETNELSPTMSNVYQQVWLGECGADKAVAPYAWLQVKSEYLDKIAAHIQEGATVMMDNEHIVVIPVGELHA